MHALTVCILFFTEQHMNQCVNIYPHKPILKDYKTSENNIVAV